MKGGPIYWMEIAPSTPSVCIEVEPGTFVIGAPAPDVVRLPKNLGGAIERVTARGRGPCLCGRHETTHYQLESVAVAECIECFLWYRDHPRKAEP